MPFTLTSLLQKIHMYMFIRYVGNVNVEHRGLTLFFFLTRYESAFKLVSN